MEYWNVGLFNWLKTIKAQGAGHKAQGKPGKLGPRPRGFCLLASIALLQFSSTPILQG